MQAYMSETTISDSSSGAHVSAGDLLRRAASALLSKGTMSLLTFALTAMVFTFASFRIIGQIDSYTLLWPVSGLVIGLALCSPYTHWRWAQRSVTAAGILIGAMAAGQSLRVAISWAALTLADMLLAGRLIGPHIRSFEDLKKRDSILRFVAAATVAPALSAIVVTLPLALHHGVPWLLVTSMSALSDSLGMAILLPAVLFVSTGEYRVLRKIAPHLRSAGGACLLFLAITSGTFWQNRGPFLFIIFPPMMMVILLLGLEGAVFSSIALSVIGWFATAHAHGPILLMRSSSSAIHVIILQVFIWVCLVTTLPVGALLDERRKAERGVLEAQTVYQLLMQNTNDAIVLSSTDGSRRYVSPAIEPLSGWSPQEYLKFERADIVHPDDRALVTLLDESLRAGKREHTLRFRLRQKAGGWRWVESTIRGYGNDSIVGYVSTVRDISLQRQTEKAWQAERRALAEEKQHLAELAGTDALTGLLNRRGLEEAVRRNDRLGTKPTAVLMVDVDYFKQFNDTYGHGAGDDCLKRLGAAILEQAARKDDLVARLGGEEFTVVLQGTDSAGAKTVADAILESLQAMAMEHSKSPLGFVSVSIGIACHNPVEAADFNLMLAQADQALYASKHKGKNRATCFTSGTDGSPAIPANEAQTDTDSIAA